MSKEITQQTRTMADELKAIATVDVTTGSVTFDGPEDIFAKHLDDGVTLDTIKHAQDSLINYANAQTLAFGELSQKAMQDNKDLKTISTKTKIGHSQFESSYTRERRGTAAGKEWVKFGVTSTDVIIGAGRKSSEYKHIVSYLGEQAANVFVC